MQQNKLLFTILFTVFLDLLGFSILIPIMPFLLTVPSSIFYILPEHFDPKNAYLLYGFLLSSYSFAQFFAAPILGQLSDKYGRKPVLLISLIGTCLSYFIFAYGIVQKDLVILFLARIFDGLTGGNISVAQAAIADITKPADRAKNFGLMGAAFGLGFIIGPYLGGKLSDPTVMSWFDATTPFYFAGILSFINVLLVWRVLPETHATKNSKRLVTVTQAFNNVKQAFTLPNLAPLFAVVFLFNAGFTFFTNFFGIFLQDRYNYNQASIGEFFGFIGVCIVITQAVITRNLAKKYSESAILRYTFFTLAAGIFLQSIAFKGAPGYLPYIIGPIIAISNGLTTANLTGLISKQANSEKQGEILGIASSVTALAIALPPIIDAFIAAHMSLATTLHIAALFLIAAGVLFNKNYRVLSIKK
jgi:MFS transporter, DHA1 family, tetracycline resistance protein